MLVGYALATLKQAKEALGIRDTDTQRDEFIEDRIRVASDYCERITGRHILYRGRPTTPQTVVTAPFTDGVLTPLTQPAAEGTLILSWPTTGDSGTVVVAGTRGGVARTETFAVDNKRQAFYGIAVFDAITSVTVSGHAAASTVNLTVSIVLPYAERHTADGMPELYVVHRPIITLLSVEEGMNETAMTVLASAYYTVNESLGKLKRLAKTVGFIDFPEDYYFRFASKVEREWGVWSPDARVNYVGGYYSLDVVPGEIRDACLIAVCGLYRERDRKDVDVASVQSTPGAVQKLEGGWRKEVDDVLKPHHRLSVSGEGLPA